MGTKKVINSIFCKSGFWHVLCESINMEKAKIIWTIGHSTHPIEKFIEMLQSFGIGMVVDIRRYPGSRKYPHFNKEHLKEVLPKYKIKYKHLEDLGGRRKTEKDSVNTGWRLASFRGYADYMRTGSFKAAIDELQELALKTQVAYMCSEAVWWSCHRALVSDYLKSHGWKVYHIMGVSKSEEHPYTSPAKIVNGKLSYPGD